MIDPQWFDAICCLSAPDLGGRDRAETIATLGVQEEVLPFLAITAGAFADWPQTREALRTAARTLSRPASARPARPQPAVRETGRAEMREALMQVLASASGSEQPDGFRTRKARKLLSEYRATGATESPEPQVFIGADDTRPAPEETAGTE